MLVRRKPVELWPVGHYRLLEKAEIPLAPGQMRQIVDAGVDIRWDGIPGPHMEPLDDQARINVKWVEDHLGGFKSLDPTAELGLVVGEIDDADTRIAELLAQIEVLKAGQRSSAAGGATRAIRPPSSVPTALPGTPAAVAPAPPMPVTVAGQGGNRPPDLPAYMVPPAPPLASLGPR